MLIPFEGESLYSLILRCLIVCGYDKLDCIVGTNGLWINNPYVPKSIQYLFHGFNDVQRFEMAHASGLVEKDTYVFGDPASFISTLQFIYANKLELTRPRRGKKAITFCMDCIRDSIQLNGCGYFKSAWLFSRTCSIHQCSLQTLSVRSKENVFYALKDVISGRLELHGTTTTIADVVKKDKLDYIDQSLPVAQAEDGLVYVMPCLKTSLSRWLVRNAERLYNDNNHMRFSLISDSMYISGKYKFLTDGKIYNYMIYAFKVREPLFIEYIAHHFQLAHYYFGMRQKESFHATVYRLSGSNCSRCLMSNIERPCPISPIIAYFELDYKVYCKNICDKKFDSW